jgi:aspartate/glutamate racemase
MWPKQAFGGSSTFGFPVGVLTISTRHALLPGNVQNAQSFPLPVLYEEVAVSDPHELMRGEAVLSQPIICAAQKLTTRGVRAIVGACGSFAYYQKAVADAVDVPVFLSIMTQVPFIQQALGTRKKLCIICAAEFSMNARVFEECHITDTSNLVFRQMCGHPEFDRMLQAADPMDPATLRDEVVAVCTDALRQESGIAAFLLQCSDLPPFACDIQEATGLPVFDMTLLIRWLQSASCYLPYAGMTRALAAQ